MKRLCRSAVVKLGGSLITIKDRVFTINWDALDLSVEQLAEYVNKYNGRLVVVHGGGSFGHPAVKEVFEKYGKHDAKGISFVQEAMLSLALKVLKALRAYNVDVVLHTTHTLCDCRSCAYDSVLRDYELGLVPLTYGDAVQCGKGFVVVSGDKLASEIALRINADCLIYAVDVPGILTPSGAVLRKVRVSEALKILGESSDVTGGMKGKIMEASKALGKVKRIVITSGAGYGIIRALRGEEVGTEVVK